MNVLALGAHPDDIEGGCFGTLAKYKEEGHKIFMAVMTKGENGGDWEKRQVEGIECANLLDVKLQYADFPDGKLPDDSTVTGYIEKLIKDNEIDVVFCTTEYDFHQDHRNLSLCAKRSMRYVKEFYCYQEPTTPYQFNPTMFVDITDTFAIKEKAIRLHATQGHKPDLQLARMWTLAEYYGFKLGEHGKLFEAFEVKKLQK